MFLDGERKMHHWKRAAFSKTAQTPAKIEKPLGT
jgi:hypothetical protein